MNDEQRKKLAKMFQVLDDFSYGGNELTNYRGWDNMGIEDKIHFLKLVVMELLQDRLRAGSN